MNTMVLTRPAERHQRLRRPATPAALAGTWGRYRTPGGEAAYFTLALAGEPS
jgi:hypothetical protein